jgi:phosphatidylserine decarboxylase
MARIKGLLAMNERVVLKGAWEHGLFTYTAVGAYNVGSIVIDADPNLQTNRKVARTNKPVFFENPLATLEKTHVDFGKGDRVGSFRLGSTIVLVFEAPSDFEFVVQPGEKLKVGQSIGRIKAEPSASLAVEAAIANSNPVTPIVASSA